MSIVDTGKAAVTAAQIEDCIYQLYDVYCRGHIDRRPYCRRVGEAIYASGRGMAVFQRHRS